MMKISSKTALIFSFVLAVFISPAKAENVCGKITIADMNWNSATLLAHVDQFILNHGFDCKAELVPGDTMPTGASMIERGEPDVAPEFWTNAMKEGLDRGIAEGRLHIAGKVLLEGGVEGFWVPKYLVEKYPEMTSIQGVIKHAKLFEHPEYSDKSAFYNCPVGWNCQISASNLFHALKLDDAGFEVVDPGSGAAMSGAISRAYEREKPWFGYYWGPSAVLGKYDLVQVDFGVKADVNEFLTCTTKADCLNPKATMYPASPVSTLVTDNFVSQSLKAMEYFERRTFSNDQMNELLAWMEENQADGEMAMEHFLREYKPIWQDWLSDEQEVKVQKAVDRL